MISTILYRPLVHLTGENEDPEFDACKKNITTRIYRSKIPEYSNVIGRYSVLPYYQELENELKTKKCKLVNSYSQHRYIADIMNWVQDIHEYTPKTWNSWGHLEHGKWIVKGLTNSQKSQWNTHMFAEGREQLLEVIRKLMDDTFIGSQGLVVREYIPLQTFDIAINGLPVSEEYRCFFLDNHFIEGAWYWSEHPDYKKDIPKDGKIFACMIAEKIQKKTKFFVIDIARTETGKWIVIEINDGQMSGLSCIDPHQFYSKLHSILNNLS
jgi:hypothetical protein